MHFFPFRTWEVEQVEPQIEEVGGVSHCMFAILFDIVFISSHLNPLDVLLPNEDEFYGDDEEDHTRNAQTIFLLSYFSVLTIYFSEINFWRICEIKNCYIFTVIFISLDN